MPEKLANATAVDKALYLYELLLFSDKEYCALELSDILQCSKSTVSRLLKQIQVRKGADLKRRLDNGREWYSLAKPPQCPRLTCSEAELRLMAECAEAGRAALGEEKYKILQRLSERLRVIFTFNERNVANNIPVFRDWASYTEKAAILIKLLEAIADSRICTIQYLKKDGSSHIWDVCPRGLITGDGILYLSAVIPPTWSSDDENAEPYFFAVRRIQDVTVKTKICREQDQAEPFPVGALEGESFLVKVHVSAKAAEYVKGRLFSIDQTLEENKDGSVDIRFRASSQHRVISWVLSCGANVELLEPASLRKRLKRELEAVLHKY